MTIDTMFRQTDFYSLSGPPGHPASVAQGPAMHEPSKKPEIGIRESSLRPKRGNIPATSSRVEHLDPLVNQLCRVCDEPAAGFHFGAFTCEGCKSFFGRTCNNQSVISECKNQYRCVVDKKNRTSCKACRLRKCLMVGMSKSGSRYGRRSNWFKIHCLMQANGSKRPPAPHHPPPPPPPASTGGESQLPPTLRWPLAPSLSPLSPMARLPLPPLQLPGPGHSPAASVKSVSAFESYANLLKQARETASNETAAGRQRPEAEDGDLISVSRSPSPPPVSPGPSPLNISCVSDTSSKSSHSLLSEAEARPGHPLLDINKNGADLSKLATPSHPLFPFGLSPPQLPSPLSPLYNPLSFAASPLYRLSPLLAANSLFGNPLLMFGQKSHLDILEEHRKLIEKFGIASAAASKSCEESFEEKPDVESRGEKTVKLESDPIDLTFKTSDDDKYEAAAETGTRTPESCRV